MGERRVTPTPIPPWATLASGAASGLASCLLLQPMDFLKTRMQQQRAPAIDSTELNLVEGRAKKPSRTARLVQTTKQVLRDDGWTGLWRGTVPTVARNVPGVAMYFYSVSEIRALISSSAIPVLSLPPSSSSSAGSPTGSNTTTLARLTITGNLVSGAFARVVVGFILCPITVVKARFESSHFAKSAYPSLSSALINIYRSDGVKGLFRGFTATALRDAPYAGLYLAFYEASKHRLGSWEAGTHGPRGSGNSLVVSLSGLFAGTVATVLTHPFDILKTRVQTSPSTSLQSSAAGQEAKTLIATTRHIIATDGWGAFLDGLGLRCARKAASSAIGWTIFEAGRGLWASHNARTQAEARAASGTNPDLSKKQLSRQDKR